MKYLVNNLPGNECNEFDTVSADKETRPEKKFAEKGFRFKKNKKSKLIEDIKSHILKVIGSDDLSTLNFSYCLSKEPRYHYTYLTNIFSEAEGISIKKYIIQQKIERVKKLLLSEGLSLKQISLLMKYKSASHLTNQFKKMKGMPPQILEK